MSTTIGIVIHRGILSLDEQLTLIDIVERKSGLKDSKDEWNFLGMRGRNFCGIDKYSEEDQKILKNFTKRFKDRTEEKDSTLVWSDVTHMLTLFYPESKGIHWHRDEHGKNNGDVGAPVYSLSLGNSCVFEYKTSKDNKICSIELHSGDLIVFGGPEREMEHRVRSVKKGSFKHLEGFDARINLTLRTCTGLTGKDEEMYQTEAYVKRLKEKWSKKDRQRSGDK